MLAQLREWATALGFSQIGVAGVDLAHAEPGLLQWLDNGFHGSMAYMAAHGLKRARPAELVPGTLRVITARMNYLPAATAQGWQAVEWARINDPAQVTLSLYARGRDYHKVMRARLQQLAEKLAQHVGPFGHRVFTDSAPLLEVELASVSGTGWRGKHTLALDRDGGSMFFLGEICIDLALPVTAPVEAHCGTCSACIDVCPTRAIVGPYRLDARRCISYLTIEHAGPIPLELRPLIGNRIYGCDDCLAVCPWNKFARDGSLMKPHARAGLAAPDLLELLALDDDGFKMKFAGTPMLRTKRRGLLRNVCVALGNVGTSDDFPALERAAQDPEPLIAEHAAWAIARIRERAAIRA